MESLLFWQEFYCKLFYSIFIIIVGYNNGEQHLSKSKVNSSESDLPPQVGTHGQPDGHISGQHGPEIMGGKLLVSLQKKLKNEAIILFSKLEKRFVTFSIFLFFPFKDQQVYTCS